LLESGAGQAERGGLAGDRAVGLCRGRERAQQIGQRGFAGTERLVDQGRAFSQQAGPGGFSIQLSLGRAQRVARGCGIAVQAFTQTLLLRLGHVQFGQRSRYQRPISVVGAEGQAQADDHAALGGLPPAPNVLTHPHGQLGRVATRVAHQVRALACQRRRLAGELQLWVSGCCRWGHVGNDRCRQIGLGRQPGEQGPTCAGGLQALAHVELQCGRRQLFGLGGQRICTCQIASAHAAFDIVGELLQRLRLAVGLRSLGLRGRELPRGFAQFTGKAKAGHLFGRLCLGHRSLGGGRTGDSLARQPQRHGDTDLGFALASVALQAVVAVAQLQRRWSSPEAARSGAVGLGAAALAVSLAGRDGTLPSHVQGVAESGNAGCWAGCRWYGLGTLWGCGRLGPDRPGGQAARDDAGRQPVERLHDDPDDSTAGADRARVQVTPEADRSLRGEPGQREAGRP
jgi:hypothetical protein